MGEVVQGLREALGLLVAGDPGLYEIVWLSLQVSGIALLMATLVGIGRGRRWGWHDFRGGDWR